jgi:uncharacterized protein YndB with AHSA1/START domain
METKTNAPRVSDSKPIHISRTFTMPLSKLWRAWSEPALMKRWWGPSEFTCPSCSIDFRVGGKILACMKDKDGKEFWSTGTYREIVPEKKIVVTDSFSDDKGNIISAKELGMPGEWPRECLVTLHFEEINGNAAVKLKHEGIPAEMYQDCIKGWNESLDKIDRL